MRTDVAFIPSEDAGHLEAQYLRYHSHCRECQSDPDAGSEVLAEKPACAGPLPKVLLLLVVSRISRYARVRILGYGCVRVRIRRHNSTSYCPWLALECLACKS